MPPTAGSSTAEAAAPGPVPAPAAAFYFDLASPLAYLVAERVLHVLPGPAEWQPVLSAELAGAGGAPALEGAGPPEDLRDELARRALELGLQPLRWPDPFPFDSSLAMLAATYAKSIGRVVGFAQAAFRQAFAGGRCLEDPDYVLMAAAACEMHPAAVLRGVRLRSTAAALASATAQAGARGVTSVPALALGAEVFHGEHALRDAAARMLDSDPSMRGSGTEASRR